MLDALFLFGVKGQGWAEQLGQHLLSEFGGAVPQSRAAVNAAHPHQRFQGRHQRLQPFRYIQCVCLIVGRGGRGVLPRILRSPVCYSQGSLPLISCCFWTFCRGFLWVFSLVGISSKKIRFFYDVHFVFKTGREKFCEYDWNLDLGLQSFSVGRKLPKQFYLK